MCHNGHNGALDDDGGYRFGDDPATGCIWYPDARMFKRRSRMDNEGIMTDVVAALRERVESL